MTTNYFDFKETTMSTNTVTDITKCHEDAITRLPGGMGGHLKEWGLLQYAKELLNGVSSAPATHTTFGIGDRVTDEQIFNLANKHDQGFSHDTPYGFFESDLLSFARELLTVCAPTHTTFKLGDRVTKKSGSRWTGKVVGFYSTDLTPEGYAVESDTETGSVQIYPAKALELVPTCTPSSTQSGNPS